MTPEQVFSIANTIALLAWVALAVFPRQRTLTRVTGTIVPSLFAVAYIAIIGTSWGSSSGGFGSLTGVAQLFSNPWVLLAGWIHYLAFDLLVGHWEVRDAQSRGIPHLLVVPSLALTFMFGPAGWFFYLVLRTARSK